MEITVLLILILINGFFALSEIALVSSKPSRLEQYRLEGSKGATIALKLLSKSENFLSAIQVGITLIGIVTGVYGGMNIADDITPFFQRIDFLKEYAYQLSLGLTVIAITYISIVIGELVPKSIALTKPDRIAIKVAPIIYYFSSIFYPFVKILSFSTSLIVKILGIKKNTEHVTEEELKHMIKIASMEGVIEKEQNIIHEKVFYFSDKKAKHIMTHRTDVEWINIEEPEEIIHQKLMNIQHSKIVCSRGELENFIGILYMRDYYKRDATGNITPLSQIIVSPVIVPENSDAQTVLNLLRSKKIHICFVVNEYGGFEGIITIHDIIENIVGQIPDEGETYEPDVFIREDKTVLVNGDAPIETLVDIIKDFKIDFEKIDYSTVAGFVLDHLNKMPHLGDNFEYNGYIIEIIDLDGNRIDKILIRKTK